MGQQVRGAAVWRDTFIPLRIPKISNFRTDMYERADPDADSSYPWMVQPSIKIPVGQKSGARNRGQTPISATDISLNRLIDFFDVR